MVLNYVKSSSAVEPVALDTTSSETTVFIRKNIKLVTVEDPEGNESQVWQYDEAQLTKAEYALYSANLETEVAVAELSESTDQSFLDIEEAIAELADIVIGE